MCAVLLRAFDGMRTHAHIIPISQNDYDPGCKGISHLQSAHVLTSEMYCFYARGSKFSQQPFLVVSNERRTPWTFFSGIIECSRRVIIVCVKSDICLWGCENNTYSIQAYPNLFVSYIREPRSMRSNIQCKKYTTSDSGFTFYAVFCFDCGYHPAIRRH